MGNFWEPSEGKEGIFLRFCKTHNMTVAMVTGTNIFGGGACDSTWEPKQNCKTKLRKVKHKNEVKHTNYKNSLVKGK